MSQFLLVSRTESEGSECVWALMKIDVVQYRVEIMLISEGTYQDEENLCLILF